MNESDKVRILRELDEGTEWESNGDLLAANDPTGDDDEDGGVATLSRPHLHPLDGGAEADVDSMERPANASEITNTVRDMVLNGRVEDLLVVINTPEGEQILLTTLNRNDHIIGMLSVATMNWHSSQIASLNWYGEEGE